MEVLSPATITFNAEETRLIEAYLAETMLNEFVTVPPGERVEILPNQFVEVPPAYRVYINHINNDEPELNVAFPETNGSGSRAVQLRKLWDFFKHNGLYLERGMGISNFNYDDWERPHKQYVPAEEAGAPYAENHEEYARQTGIYRIFHKHTNTSYIGQSNSIPQRIQNHYTPKGAERFGMDKKEMIENMKWEILEICAKESLIEREAYWIEKFNCKYPNGYNNRREKG